MLKVILEKSYSKINKYYTVLMEILKKENN